jgi:uncharacterized protein (DUF1684 family)
MGMIKVGLATTALVAGVLILPRMLVANGSGYESEIRKWREQRETRLKADGGWLTVAGLFWLEEGANRFGADASNEIVLPPGSAPPRAGVFEFHDGKATVKIEPDVVVTVEGKPITVMDLKSDAGGAPDVLTLGSLTLQVIERGERHAIRLKDMNSRFRREFTGLRWFPVNDSLRVTARWVPYDPPREISVPTILGTIEKMPCPGAALFTVGGKEARLEPVLEEPGAEELFFIFRDATSGGKTYGSGRFLYAALPKDGKVVLDFNKAYNPPCAFTPYATCPLPPEQNRLSIPIEAGELSYDHH